MIHQFNPAHILCTNCGAGSNRPTVPYSFWESISVGISALFRFPKVDSRIKIYSLIVIESNAKRDVVKKLLLIKCV